MQSAIRSDNMIDLLLKPLERILEYREFLERLLSWADRKQTSDFEILGKATRRIGRLANYIEKYKYGIYNKNEMNKVQRFLKDQSNVLAPDRFIVRRGMMTRRVSGWA